MRVAVNHPYFFPYAGYYRLMAYADVMVLFDCVQFPRRGYVHRNQLLDQQGNLAWFSLLLKKQARDVLIRDIRFVDDIGRQLAKSVQRFPVLMANREHALLQRLLALTSTDSPCDYLCESLAQVRDMLGLECRLVRSSSLAVDPALKGEERVLAILDALDAHEYVNAPSGKRLYSEDKFAARGITLKFLQAYPDEQLPFRSSMLQRILEEDALELRHEIEEQLQWQR